MFLASFFIRIVSLFTSNIQLICYSTRFFKDKNEFNWESVFFKLLVRDNF